MIPAQLSTMRSYPKRHNIRKHYEEDVISDEDEYVCECVYLNSLLIKASVIVMLCLV